MPVRWPLARIVAAAEDDLNASRMLPTPRASHALAKLVEREHRADSSDHRANVELDAAPAGWAGCPEAVPELEQVVEVAYAVATGHVVDCTKAQWMGL